MSSEAMRLCICGEMHPFGYICEKAQKNTSFECHSTEQEHAPECVHDANSHSDHAHCCNSEQTPVKTNCWSHNHNAPDPDDHDDRCSAKHNHEHNHDQGACCGHEHADMQAVDWQALGKSSSTRAIYRIVNMDCPMEEALIRKKLAGIPGITSLEFNLMQRVLTVNHKLPSTDIIVNALKSIDMTPEALHGDEGSLAVFSINGMDCPVEEKLIRSKLAKMPGVYGLDYNLMQRILKVRYEPSALPAISKALDSLNMGAKLLEAGKKKDNVIPEPKIPWKKLAIAGVFAALSESFELIHEWHVKPFGLDMQTWSLFNYPVLEWLPLLFAILAIALAGLTTYRKGWLAVSNLNLNINALMSVAVTGAVLIGQYPEAAMVMVLFNLSEAIEAKALDKARNAIKGLLALTPDTATVLQDDGSWQDIDVRAIAVGSTVRVKPGEKIALDGTVLNGHSMVNQAPITGESMPVEKVAGNPVYAGTINESGSFEFEVTAAATDSTLARIIHAVEEAQGSRAPMQRFVDAFAKYYTPAVFLVSILAALVPPLFMHGEWMSSIYMALVILVIGCPCALVISTPVSIVSGMAAATRYGILIKGGMFLEQGRLLQYLALDKTGTITWGKPRQTDFVIINNSDEKQTRSIAASLAGRSDHPVSRAIALAATEAGVRFKDISDFEALPGQGVSGVIEGQKWYMGNQRMLEELGKASEQVNGQIVNLEKQGKTVVALVNERGVCALIAVADTVRKTSIEAINQLKKLSVKTVMLTGDNPHTAEVIAKEVGVDEYRANLLPQDKLHVIENLEKNGAKVGMVGDGINDAPALAQATIGFAMAKEGTDTAIETADVALMDDDLRKIPRFISLSRSTYAILVQNITLALVVKAVFFILTFTGQATMWMAVFADVGTALLVVANGLRAMRK